MELVLAPECGGSEVIGPDRVTHTTRGHTRSALRRSILESARSKAAAAHPEVYVERRVSPATVLLNAAADADC
jgi:hypothetical protein